MALTLRFLDDLAPHAAAWDALLARQDAPTPFMRAFFLDALGRTGAASPDTGWQLLWPTLWRGDTLLWGLAQLSKVPQHAQPHQPLLQELLAAAGSLLAADSTSSSSTGSQPDSLPPASLADLVWAVAKLQQHPGELCCWHGGSTAQPASQPACLHTEPSC